MKKLSKTPSPTPPPNSHLHALFATHIYQKETLKPQTPLFKQLTSSSQDILDQDQKGHQWSQKAYKNGYTSYGSWDQLHLVAPPFAELKKKLDLHVARYLRDLNFDIQPNQIAMSRLWLNVMPAYCYHAWHIHPHSVISGTFYLQLPPGGAPIRFEDPRLGFFMNRPLVKNRKQDTHFFALNPQVGQVVLFESWLKHEVPMHLETNDVRVSLSFNYDWVRG